MIKLFCTLGPSSLNKNFLINLDKKVVKLLRINLSHTKIEDLPKIVSYIRKYTSINICFDTEGAQIRTSTLKNRSQSLIKNQRILINKENNNNKNITLLPINIYKKLKKNDLLSIDFNSAIVKIINIKGENIECFVKVGGEIGSNKSVAINRMIKLPPFTEKDKEAFKIAEDLNIRNIALSFTSHPDDVIKLKEYFNKDINIIAKIESKNGLKNLTGILNVSNSILIDRGDLSKEIPIYQIPKKQKEIISIAKKYKTPVYVATNLLESMVSQMEPTRAEVNDVYNTLKDGATGLVLAAETAIGKYPEKCIDMIVKVSKTL